MIGDNVVGNQTCQGSGHFAAAGAVLDNDGERELRPMRGAVENVTNEQRMITQ